MDERKHIRDVIAQAACETAFTGDVIIAALEKAGYTIIKQSEIETLRSMPADHAPKQAGEDFSDFDLWTMTKWAMAFAALAIAFAIASGYWRFSQ